MLDDTKVHVVCTTHIPPVVTVRHDGGEPVKPHAIGVHEFDQTSLTVLERTCDEAGSDEV